MFFAKVPNFVQLLMPSYTWRVPTSEKRLFLTFDDGPIPEVTPWVLETLHHYGAKATFFCVGDNARKNPAVFQAILQNGHAVGNHTFNHLNGWKTDASTYCQNVAKCGEMFDTTLFRPPYGRLTTLQKKSLLKDFRIILWDVLSGDFSHKIPPETCLKHVLTNARRGSIIVLHDSLKAEGNLRYVLPKILTHFSNLGYRFDAIVQDPRAIT